MFSYQWITNPTKTDSNMIATHISISYLRQIIEKKLLIDWRDPYREYSQRSKTDQKWSSTYSD